MTVGDPDMGRDMVIGSGLHRSKVALFGPPLGRARTVEMVEGARRREGEPVPVPGLAARLGGVLRSVLPPGVEVVERVGAAGAASLFPDEAAAVAGAVPARRTEYAAVRACARTALAQLGFPPVSIPSAPDRSPVWPSGVVGSMTHCDGFRAAAVAWADDWVGLGIDAEVLAPLPDGVSPLVMSDDECAALAQFDPAVCADRVLFSAKESVYKVWYPLVRRWLGFEDVDVRLGADTFVARIGPEGLGVHELYGRWVVHDGLVVTAIALRA